MNTVLKENEQFKKTLTAEQIVLMQLGKPDFQRQATLKMQGGPTLPLFARLAKKTTVGFEPPTAGFMFAHAGSLRNDQTLVELQACLYSRLDTIYT